MSEDPPRKPANRTVMGLAPVPRTLEPVPPALPPAPAPAPPFASPPTPAIDSPAFAPLAPPPPISPPIPPPPSPSTAHGIDAAPPSVSAGRVIGVTGSGAVSPRNIPGTMVGMVSPVAPQPSPDTGLPTGSSGGALRTMMGVAHPGIAPTHDKPPPSFRAAPPFIAPPPPPVIVDAPIEARPLAMPMHAPMPVADPTHDEHITLEGGRPRRSSFLPWVVIAVLAAALAVAIVAFMSRAKPAPVVTAEVRGDGDRRELVVSCARCSDGSTLVRGDATSNFTSGQATIPLQKEDATLGTHPVAVTIVDGKQRYPMTLEVAIPFFVHVDLARLATGSDSIDLVFAITPQVTGITIGDKTTVPEKGATSVTLPLPIVVATKDTERTFARTIAFEVSLGAAIHKGSLDVSIPYASLKIGLPGRNAVLPSTTGGLLDVSGRTSPSAKVQLGSDPKLVATADATGIFRGQAPAVSDDATSVSLMAYGEGLAPRQVVVGFTRAASLTKAIAFFRAKATTPFAKIALKPEDHIGEWVDVKLVVAQTGEEDGRTIAVGDVKCAVVEGGPRCPGVRVLLPASSILPKPENGVVIEVIGVVVRSFPIEKGKATGTEIDATIGDGK